MTLISLLAAMSPYTGDDRNITLYIVIGALALILIVLYLILSKKSKK